MNMMQELGALTLVGGCGIIASIYQWLMQRFGGDRKAVATWISNATRDELALQIGFLVVLATCMIFCGVIFLWGGVTTS